jgi:hypothetical protein
MLNFTILGVFFGFDVYPYLRRRQPKPAMFGVSFVLISVTSGLHALFRGIYTINMQLTPTGPKPLDIASLIVAFGPLPIFGYCRLRNLRGKPDILIAGTPTWVIVMVGVLSAYTGAFVMRFIDAVRFTHTKLQWARFDSDYNLILWGLYLVIAILWLRFQVRSRRTSGSWNLLGVSLGLTFVTMSFHRLGQAIEVSAGAYKVRDNFETTYFWIDIASIAATVLFLGVAMSLMSQGSGSGAGQPVKASVE